MIQFYTPDIKETLTLSASESAHCSRVLRKKAGDIIFVTDGKGSLYECEITDASPKGVGVRIINEQVSDPGLRYGVVIAIAPTKQFERMEWMIEKAVEIGVDGFFFIRTKRSERKEIKLERVERIIISAVNQSLKSRLPEISGILPFNDFLKMEMWEDYQKFFGYCADEKNKKELVKEFIPGKKAVILIGPEGDFTSEEVELAMESGFMPVTFGDERLRTETAALFAVTAASVLNQLS